MPRPKIERNEIKYKYRKHEIVWAKISGFPWWPASITCIPSKSNCSYKVDFIGDRSYAHLPESKIAKYLQFRNEYQMCKKSNKHFMNAVTLASTKYQQLLAKQECAIKSKNSAETKTSQQKQQLNKQIVLPLIQENLQLINDLNNQNSLHQNSQHQLAEELDIVQKQQSAIQQPISLSQMVAQNISLDQYQRQRFLEQLLIKYQLIDLQRLGQMIKEDDRRERTNKKIHWKRKIISKQKRQMQGGAWEFEEPQQVQRKVFSFLLKKLSSKQSSRVVAVSLSSQILKEKSRRVQNLKKVAEWILMSDEEHILNYHFQWVNFYMNNEREREKLSNLTIDDSREEEVK